MSDTTFTNGVTLTDADWFNDVNRLHYTIFNDPADLPAAFARINSLTEDTSPSTNSDFVLTYDTSASTAKKVKPSNLFASSASQVRQTVLNGTVDSNGLPNFGGSTGSTTVNTSTTLTLSAANGFGSSGNVDQVFQITNPSWTGLSTNGTMYLYVDYNSGSPTTGSTTLAPTYQWGGTYSTTSNQHTFNIQEMTMKVGNGSSAAQTYRVFVGEVTVAGGVVTAITWYALMGRYEGPFTATLPGTATTTSFNHNIGEYPRIVNIEAQCTTADIGYSVGDRVQVFGSSGGGVNAILNVKATAKSCAFTTGATNAMKLIDNTGVITTMTAASWKYRMLAYRGW